MDAIPDPRLGEIPAARQGGAHAFEKGTHVLPHDASVEI
jgi:hypothetical protein